MLAVGIGVNAAVFTVTSAALFGGFPLVERNDRIVYITTTSGSVYYPDFMEWRTSSRSFADVALARNFYTTISFGNGGDLDAYFTTEVTANAFAMLGVRPFLGRDFGPQDAKPGAAPVAVLRYDLWQQRFGSDPAAIGRSVTINGNPTTVIGVMPRGFSFPSDQALWTPLIPTPAALRRETPYARYAVARLADGATIDTARTELTLIGERLAAAYPDTNRGIRPVLQSFAEWSTGSQGSLLYGAAFAAIVFVLLIACANTAGLLLERALDRSREVAIRLAIGESPARASRQVLLESLMLSTLGGALGIWLAQIGLHAYALAQPAGSNTRVLSYSLSYQAIGYLTVVSLGAGLVIGLVAALGAVRSSTRYALHKVNRGVHLGRPRLSKWLVASQVALAVVLLSSTGVLVRSFLNVATADVGVMPDDILSMSLYAPPEQYATADARSSFYASLGERLAAIPGVESVGFGTAAPADYVPSSPFEIEDMPAAAEKERLGADRFFADPGYFRTLGVEAIAGRTFDGSDRASSLPVAIVNARFASLHWPAETPIGKRLRLFIGGEATPWLTIVGVVANVVQNDRTRQAFKPIIYLPYAQNPQANMFTFARTRVPPGTLVDAFRRAVYGIDPSLPVPALWPLAERFDRVYAFERLVSMVLIAFAAVALLLASVGLYAVVSRVVARRTHEIGVRAALGARAGDIRHLVLVSAAGPVGIGLAFGLAASYAVNRALVSELVGVTPGDPTILSLAVAAILAAAALGCVVPARRATRVDPVIALHHD
jgi:putative ABC transport system permease protein